MNINSLSFGRKIPINQIRVLDKQQNKFVDATFYEYDCKDLQDVQDVYDLSDEWSFSHILADGMHKQYLCNFVNMPNSKFHYYCVKNDKNVTLGLCATQEDDKEITVEFIESKPFSLLKYVGQSMLSSLAQKALLTEKEKLKIKGSLSDVKAFYEKVCGFTPINSQNQLFTSSFEMTSEELPNFIERTQDKTLKS